MRILAADSLDISGFASIRERVFIQDRQYFSHAVPDACWDAFGPLIYFASAWFLPRGSTGLHHHSQVNIVSILPRGTMLHQGSIGEGVELKAGQVQIQRSGNQGFSHNEINPTRQVQPFVQLWLTPTAQEAATYEVLTLNGNGLTTIEVRDDFELGVGTWAQANQWHSDKPSLLYVVTGGGVVSNQQGLAHPIARGTLVSACSGLIFATEANSQFFYATLATTLPK